jgi:uncharacterized protein YuzE
MEKKDLKSQIDISSFFRNRGSFTVDYDAKIDSLFLQMKNPPPAISVDCEGLFWLRVNPQNGEVVGVEIEDYRKVFLKKYHELERMKPSSNKPFVDRISKELEVCLT